MITMTLDISKDILAQIHAHGEAAYPEEGAGFLLGSDDGEQRYIAQIFVTENAREDEARHNRYLVTPQEYLQAEIAAELLGLSLIGVFHSHPTIPTVRPNSTASGRSRSFRTSSPVSMKGRPSNHAPGGWPKTGLCLKKKR